MEEKDQKVSKYSENEKELWHEVLANGFNITSLFDMVTELQQKLHKLEEAYYLRFPDRLEKDMEFQKQLAALKKPAGPKAPRKKS